jgi:hypothetical protein
MRSPFLAFLFMLPLSPACSEIPAPPSGHRISGTVRYQGDVQDKLSRPALLVLAGVRFPLEATQFPHGIVVIERPDFSHGVDYEIVYPPTYGYKVAAQLVDLDNLEQDQAQLPVGGYPDMCTLLTPEVGLVQVQDDVAAVGIDIVMFDMGGMADPCFTLSEAGGSDPLP